MKRIALLLAILAVCTIAPSAFACADCDPLSGAYCSPGHPEGGITCEENPGGCILHGSCGLKQSSRPLATQYRVAAVRVVAPGAALPAPETAPAPVVASLAR